jgi:hypothetical protein
MTTKEKPQAGRPEAETEKNTDINYRTPSPLSSPHAYIRMEYLEEAGHVWN